MTLGKVLRLMEEEDVLYFPEIKGKYEELANHGDYFFCVIENEEKERLGYLIAEKNKEKLIVITLKWQYDFKERYNYQSAAFSNLYEYIKQIKECDGKRRFFQLSII